MSIVDGWYVAPNGKTIEVKANHTVNPRIVDLHEHNLGLVVVDQEFFENEDDAKQQAKLNAELTISDCEDLLAELEKPKRRPASTKPSKSIFNIHRREEDDPLGPPDYGVGRTLKHRKTGTTVKIVGYQDNEEVMYILNSNKGGSSRLTRDQLDRQYEVAS